MGAPLSSATGAALWSATRGAGEAKLVELAPIMGSGKYDVCLPVSNQAQAASLVADVRLWDENHKGDANKNVLAPLSHATTAGELYEIQVKSAVARYGKKLEAIAEDYRKVGKYTKEHAQQMVAARGILYRELADVMPSANFYRMTTADPALASARALLREASDTEALPRLSGKRASNLARGMVKRGQTRVTAAEDAPVLIDRRIADKLKVLDKILVVVKLGPIAVRALRTENDEEREKALKELAATSAGIAVDKFVMAAGTTFCAAFAVTSLGWGLLVCGLGVVAAGSYIGERVEDHVKKALMPSASP